MALIKIALLYYIKAYRFIINNKLYWSFIVPIVFNLVLISGLLYLTYSFGQSLNTDLIEYIEQNLGLPEWLKSSIGYILSVIPFLIILLGAAIYYFLFKHVLFLILGPFFAYIGDKAYESSGNTPLPFSFFLKNLVNTTRLNIRILIIQMIILLLFYITLFIPILNLFSPLILICFEFYYSGISILANNCERHNYSYNESLGFFKSNKGYAFGLGLGFWLLMIIPFFGWIMAPILSIVASVLLFENEIKHA